MQPKRRGSPRKMDLLLQNHSDIMNRESNSVLEQRGGTSETESSYLPSQGRKMTLNSNIKNVREDLLNEDHDMELLSREIDEDVPTIHSLKTKL